MSGSRGGRVALVVVLVAAVVLVLAQIVLPGVAASRVRTRLSDYGQVRSVHVSALPAVELLWGSADSVHVAAGKLAFTLAQVAPLLGEARGLGTLDVSADAVLLRVPPLLERGLAVEQAHMRKSGSALSATATLTQQQLAAALPSGVGLEPIASGSGEVEARASGALFGLQASVDVRVRAVEGRLIAEPTNVPFGSLAAVTVFSDPHLKVQGVGVRVLSSRPLSYQLTVSAQLV